MLSLICHSHAGTAGLEFCLSLGSPTFTGKLKTGADGEDRIRETGGGRSLDDKIWMFAFRETSRGLLGAALLCIRTYPRGALSLTAWTI